MSAVASSTLNGPDGRGSPVRSTLGAIAEALGYDADQVADLHALGLGAQSLPVGNFSPGRGVGGADLRLASLPPRT